MTSPVLFFAIYGALTLILLVLFCLAPTRFFYVRTDNKKFKLKKRKLLIAATLFVLCLQPMWWLIPAGIARLLHGGQLIATSSVNHHRFTNAMTLQAMSTLYPNIDSTCAWQTAVGFIDEVQGRLYRKHFCQQDGGLCASSMHDVYVQKYALINDLDRNLLTDLKAVGQATDAVWEISKEKYALLRSIAKYKGTLTADEEKEMSGKFYDQADLPSYLALWDQKQQCHQIDMPAWGDDLNQPLRLQNSGGLIPRWSRYE